MKNLSLQKPVKVKNKKYKVPKTIYAEVANSIDKQDCKLKTLLVTPSNTTSLTFLIETNRVERHVFK